MNYPYSPFIHSFILFFLTFCSKSDSTFITEKWKAKLTTKMIS